MPINPALLLSHGAPTGLPLPAPGPGGIMPPSSPMGAPGPLPPAPMPAGPAPMPPGAGLQAMNSAALLALQGQAPEPPPNWKVDTQADGTLLLKDVKPDGTEIVRKIVSPPKSSKGK